MEMVMHNNHDENLNILYYLIEKLKDMENEYDQYNTHQYYNVHLKEKDSYQYLKILKKIDALQLAKKRCKNFLTS